LCSQSKDRRRIIDLQSSEDVRGILLLSPVPGLQDPLATAYKRQKKWQELFLIIVPFSVRMLVSCHRLLRHPSKEQLSPALSSLPHVKLTTSKSPHPSAAAHLSTSELRADCARRSIGSISHNPFLARLVHRDMNRWAKSFAMLRPSDANGPLKLVTAMCNTSG